jgi:hypothetical protein
LIPLLAILAMMTAPPADAPASKQVETLLQNCDAHKFETTVELIGPDGQPKHSRMKLCGTEGQSDADWVRTLKDAVAKTQANSRMPKPVRDQVVAAISAEIVRLEVPSAPAATVALPPPRFSPSGSALAGYGALPPLPDKPPPPVHVMAAGSAALPTLPRPKMSFICSTLSEFAEGPCADFSRDTLLTVRADEDLPAGTSLRFALNGDPRADVDLAPLKRGRSMRFPLPGGVCDHVTGGSLEIRIVRAAAAAGSGEQEVGIDGPYPLRC